MERWKKGPGGAHARAPSVPTALLWSGEQAEQQRVPQSSQVHTPAALLGMRAGSTGGAPGAVQASQRAQRAQRARLVVAHADGQVEGLGGGREHAAALAHELDRLALVVHQQSRRLVHVEKRALQRVQVPVVRLRAFRVQGFRCGTAPSPLVQLLCMRVSPSCSVKQNLMPGDSQ